jgi:aryl-phospho-beta-D-glucosidase BglC (GH1 family)
MVSPNATEEDLRVLGQEWKANLIRWQLCGFKPRMDTGDTAAYETMLAEHLKKLDAILPACEKYGLMVVVDLHTGPGQWAESGRGLFTSAACQKRFVEIWREIARRYKNAKAVWGYDLVNEPHESPFDPELSDWQELAERAAKAIRAIDPERTIIVEPAEGGGPGGMAQLRPIAVPNVVYSVHMYNPGSFTHQGVFGEWVKKIPYPGETEGKMWDKAALEASLKPVIDFQKAFGVQIYAGEFSAIRWAPDGSACRYLKDLIDIFESRGWDWTYHAFREWQGWSAEHGPDKADARPAAEPTDRENLLREWYAKNQKPQW